MSLTTIKIDSAIRDRLRELDYLGKTYDEILHKLIRRERARVAAAQMAAYVPTPDDIAEEALWARATTADWLREEALASDASR